MHRPLMEERLLTYIRKADNKLGFRAFKFGSLTVIREVQSQRTLWHHIAVKLSYRAFKFATIATSLISQYIAMSRDLDTTVLPSLKCCQAQLQSLRCERTLSYEPMAFIQDIVPTDCSCLQTQLQSLQV